MEAALCGLNGAPRSTSTSRLGEPQKVPLLAPFWRAQNRAAKLNDVRGDVEPKVDVDDKDEWFAGGGQFTGQLRRRRF